MASVKKRRWTHKGVTKEVWQVRYTDPATGKQPSASFPLKKDADAFRRKIEAELDAGVHVSRSSSRTMNALFDEYLDHLTRRVDNEELSAAQLDSIRRSLSYAREDFGNVLLIDLKWERVEAYGNALRRRPTKYLKRTFSNVTVRKALQALSQAVGWGVRRNYAARNVVTDALREIGNLPPRPIDHFNQEEMTRVVAAIEDRAGLARRSQALLRAIVYLGAMCGLRRGEILGMRWDRIDFDNRSITIDASLTNKDVLKETKTKAGMRFVPLPRMVADALRAWEPFIIADDRGLIFRTFRGRAIADHNLYTAYWHPLLRRAGFQPVDGRHRHFHATRHFAGSAWLAAGVPLAEVSRLLGHANTAITAKIYAHAINDVMTRAPEMDRVAGMLCTTPRALTAQGLHIAA